MYKVRISSSSRIATKWRVPAGRYTARSGGTIHAAVSVWTRITPDTA